MKKSIIVFVLTLAASTAFVKSSCIAQNTISYSSTLIIPASDKSKSFKTVSGPHNISDQIFDAGENAGAIRIVSAKIETANPNKSLAMFKSVKMYLSLGDEGSHEVLVASQNNISANAGSRITLNIDFDKTVAIGYGSTKKKDLTGSVVSIDGDQLKDLNVSRADQAILGRLAGVQVINNGEPGGTPQVRIRGIGTMLAGASPLYVVDGFPTDNIQAINPSDIESIDVLKDASSTSIYGSRGSNGVVLINTKTGKSDPSSGILDIREGSTIKLRMEYQLRDALEADTDVLANLSFNSEPISSLKYK